jgi:hypothetical protein
MQLAQTRGLGFFARLLSSSCALAQPCSSVFFHASQTRHRANVFSHSRQRKGGFLASMPARRLKSSTFVLSKARRPFCTSQTSHG